MKNVKLNRYDDSLNLEILKCEAAVSADPTAIQDLMNIRDGFYESVIIKEETVNGGMLSSFYLFHIY